MKNPEPTREELLQLFMDDVLASQMGHSFGLGSRPAAIRVIEERCAALHNEGAFDLLHLVERGSFQQLNGPSFFIATHVFCHILPELDATPVRMMTCVEALVAHGGADLAATQPNAAFRSWCAKDPHRAREVIAAAHNGDDLASRHLAFALEAVSDITEARQISLAYHDNRRLAAILALGRIDDPDPTSCVETLAAFGTLLDAGADDKLRASLLGATTEILARNPDLLSPDAVTLVHRLVENGGDFTVHQCAHMLCVSRPALRSDIVSSLLDALMHLNPANKGTVNELDLGLQSLLKHGHEDEAISFVTQLLSLPDSGLKLAELNSFIRTLLDGPSDRLSRVVVQWLLLGAPRLCQGIADSLRSRDLAGPPLDLRAEDLAISPVDQVFLCCKAIGWFFLKPITAASILVSVLRICDAETAKEVQLLLVEHLLMNYHGVREYLEALPSDDLAKGHVDQALEQHKIHFNAVRAIPPIKELQPSEHHRRIQHLRWSDPMRAALERAQGQSILLTLTKKSVLLYGNRARILIKDGEDTFRSVEMKMQSHGVSFEMPRMESVDPVGFYWIRHNFRYEERTP